MDKFKRMDEVFMVMIRGKFSFTLISQTIGLLGVSDESKMWKLTNNMHGHCWDG
jgi:hypothetical protein